MVSLGKFFGRAASDAAGFAIGGAVSEPLRPPLQDLINAAWYSHPNMPLNVVDLAQGVASGQVPRDWAAGEATFTGFNAERFGRLVHIFDTGPGVASAYTLWRRGIIDEPGFRRALKREALEPEWVDALVEARQVLLTPAELANARQQMFIGEDRQKAEAAKQGIDAERADIQFKLAGLPPGVETGLEMLRRGIITEQEFAQLVAEGHTKTKYTDELLALRHPVLSATQAATLRLKGWISAETSYQLGALTGYTPEQMDRLFLAMGRPAAPVQMFQAWARGVDGPDGRPVDEAQFLKAIRQSDIRPEYGPTLWGIRHAYPSLFQLRRAVQDGGISRQRALRILHFERYEDADALALVNSWTASTATGAKGLTAAELTAEYEGHYLTKAEYVGDLQALGYSVQQANEKADVVDAKRVKRARDSVVARIRSEYVRHRISRDVAAAALNTEQIPAPARDLVLTEWDHERELTADAMTAAQIKKAYKATIFDRATALARIERLGYDAADAAIYLDET